MSFPASTLDVQWENHGKNEDPFEALLDYEWANVLQCLGFSSLKHGLINTAQTFPGKEMKCFLVNSSSRKSN